MASFVAMGMVSSVRADFSFPFSSWASRLMIMVSSGSDLSGYSTPRSAICFSVLKLGWCLSTGWSWLDGQSSEPGERWEKP